MRAKLLLAGTLALLLAGCSGRVSHAPPPLNKQALTGKWRSPAPESFILGYDFADDGTFTMTVWHMDRPVAGRYAWSGERDLDLDYQVTPEVRQAYEAAVKAYKEKVNDLPGLARPSMLRLVRDELPARETVRVGISETRPELILTPDNGMSQNFLKAE
jgi:hypothetical protein